MKNLKRIAALLAAGIMAMGMMTTSFAADSGQGGDASITITLPADNAGTDEEITYQLYKVFDATNDGNSSAIAYTIDEANGELTDAMLAAGFAVDSAGNVTFNGNMAGDGNPSDAAIAAVAAYAKDLIGEFTAKPSEKTLEITGLTYGYYFVTTTTGTLVTLDSTNPNAFVQDKNELPAPPDKKIVSGDDFVGSIDEAGKNALAQVGTTVYFSVDIDVVKGAANYVFHDQMSNGLAYKNDVAVNPAASVSSTETADGDTLTVTFDNEWLAANAGETITITYSATVTSDALSMRPALNTASLDYGEGHTTDMDEVKVYNANINIEKTDAEQDPIQGAGFVIQNENGEYYRMSNNVVSWYALPEGTSLSDAIAEGAVTEYTSDAQGIVTAFSGLKDGNYTLIESTVPAGYNKAADITFPIAAGDYDVKNLQQGSTVVNYSGTELPSTGGIGTRIFYLLGAVLVLGAGVVLITRKRMSTR